MPDIYFRVKIDSRNTFFKSNFIRTIKKSKKLKWTFYLYLSVSSFLPEKIFSSKNYPWKSHDLSYTRKDRKMSVKEEALKVTRSYTASHRSFESTAHIRLIFIPAMYSPLTIHLSRTCIRFTLNPDFTLRSHFDFALSSIKALFQASRELFAARYLILAHFSLPRPGYFRWELIRRSGVD